MPLFFFAFIRATADNGVKIAFNGFYLFGGGIIPTATRTSDRGRKTERQRATATRERNATPRTAHFFGSSRLFLGLVVFSAGWNGSNAIQAIFDGFTAHGLKTRNGSRTRHGFPISHRKRSRAGATTEITQTVNRFVNKKSPTISRAYLLGNCRGNLSY